MFTALTITINSRVIIIYFLKKTIFLFILFRAVF